MTCVLFPSETLYPSVSIYPCIGSRPVAIFVTTVSEFNIADNISEEYTIEAFKSQEFTIELVPGDR